MTWWHRHTWEESERFYAAPPVSEFKMNGGTRDMFLTVLMGVTTIVYRCSQLNCRAVNKVEIIGKTLSPTEDKKKI